MKLSRTEVKNDWSYTSTLPYAFMTCTGTTKLSSTAVIPKAGYANPQGYEPGHLGVREKFNNG